MTAGCGERRDEASPRYRDWIAAGAVAALLSGLAILMTWPLLPNLDRAVTDPGDPYINTFILDWVASRLAAGSLEFFDAPLAYPARSSLAFSEHLIGLGVLALPFHLAGVPPLITYNVIFLLGFVASGIGAWLLTWHIGRSHVAAGLAAVAYAFVPYRMGQASHLQHVWSPWLPVALWALLTLSERPVVRRATVVTAAVVMLGLTNIHWLLFGSFALAASTLVLTIGSPRRKRFALLACLSFVVAGVLLLPTLLPYRRAANEQRMERTAGETARYSATPSDWLIRPASAHAWSQPTMPHEPERRLFPGLVLTGGAFASLLLLRRNPPPRRSALYILWLWIVIGFFGSLGLNAPFHRFLFEHFEPFRAIRAPSRWAMVTYTGLAASFGVATVALRRFRAPTRLAIAALTLAALLWEVSTFPMRWFLSDVDHAAVYSWMRDLPPGGGTLELPVGVNTSEYEYTLAITTHHRPIVNGTAGTRFQRVVAAMANADPVPDRLIDLLERANVKLLVVHLDRLGKVQPATIEFLRRNLGSGRLLVFGRFPHEYRGDFVFVVAPVTRTPDPLDTLLAQQADRDRSTLDLMSAGRFMPTERPIGILDFPPPGYRSVGGLLVSGWAMAPRGIREVTVLFNNGLVGHRAHLIPRPDVEKAHPGIPASGFRLEFSKRPPEVWTKADLQVRIEDGAGRVTYLPHIWFEWVDPQR